MHIIGPRATDLIAEGALAIGGEMTLDEIVATIHSHPTVTESVRECALDALGRAVHIPTPQEKIRQEGTDSYEDHWLPGAGHHGAMA